MRALLFSPTANVFAALCQSTFAVGAVIAASLCAITGLAQDVHAQRNYKTSAGPVTVKRIAGPLSKPWAIAFLPAPDTQLVTERDGAMRVIRRGKISRPVRGVPEVYGYGQGGLLDVALAPDFAETSRIFFTFAEPVGHKARTALASARLLNWRGTTPRLADLKILFRQQPARASGLHFGSRIIIQDDGTLFITTGDRGWSDRVQDLSNHLGKVIRLRLDGKIPDDNPFLNTRGALPEIWSLGHRNPQGAARHPSTGAYYTISHGARGGDEVNRPVAGRNYGWPTISYGRHYSGRKIGIGTRAAGMEQPLHYWDPSIAPSGAVFYDGDLFPAWRGHLLVGALRGRLISRLEPTADGKFREAERLLQGRFGRVRDVRVGPKGAIWFATDDDDGGIYRITPAD